MLTYPRFAKACYAFFAVAVLAAVLKLSVSAADPALLKILPAVPTASAIEAPPKGPEDPRLGGFSDDGGARRLQASLSRPASREDVSEGPAGGANDASGDASVFRRPSLDRGLSSEPVCGDLGDVPRSSRVVFPLPERYFDSYDDTWGAARPQGGHEGTDLMSPAGTPEFALTDGRLVAVAGSNENGWNTLGGYTVMLEAAYSVGPIKKGDLFYYAHLDRKSALPIGTEVRAGQRIGTVGDTGEGPEGTRGKFPPHLHLGWYDADLSEKRSQAESGAMDPYPLLLWLEENGGAVSGGTDASYCQAPQGPNPAPSTGEPDWPVSPSPGQRPDLDTGSDESASPRPGIANDKALKNRPKRDGQGGRGEDKDGGSGKDKGKIEQPDRDHKEGKKLSPRKKVQAKATTLLRDLPRPRFDRTIPENRGGEAQDPERDGDDRRDGGTGGESEEGQRRIERPVGDRLEGDRNARPRPPKPAPPQKPDPDPVGSRPAPEGTGQAPRVVEEPEAATPPESGRERPAPKPAPLPDDAPANEPVGGGGTSVEATNPVRDEAPPVVEEEAQPAVEAGGGGE